MGLLVLPFLEEDAVAYRNDGKLCFEGEEIRMDIPEMTPAEKAAAEEVWRELRAPHVPLETANAEQLA